VGTALTAPRTKARKTTAKKDFIGDGFGRFDGCMMFHPLALVGLENSFYSMQLHNTKIGNYLKISKASRQKPSFGALLPFTQLKHTTTPQPYHKQCRTPRETQDH
jgi:hypothetical protein